MESVVKTDPCLYDIMMLQESALNRLLPKASTRTLARLIAAYPRSVGRIFLDCMSKTMSRSTVEFIKDELHTAQLPTYGQIREAERELFKIMHEERIGQETPQEQHALVKH